MEDKILEFKERIEDDDEFRSLFVNAYNLDEIVDIAREQGYSFDMDEIIEDPELSDQFLEAVAGGKDNTYTYRIIGDRNLIFEANNKEEAEKLAYTLRDKLHDKGICGTC